MQHRAPTRAQAHCAENLRPDLVSDGSPGIPMVPRSIENLKEEVGRLAAVLEQLQARIAPVCRFEPECPFDKDNVATAAPSCGLAGTIQDIAERVSTLGDEMNLLLNRLEI